jgi:hypothetical protein
LDVLTGFESDELTVGCCANAPANGTSKLNASAKAGAAAVVFQRARVRDISIPLSKIQNRKLR